MFIDSTLAITSLCISMLLVGSFPQAADARTELLPLLLLVGLLAGGISHVLGLPRISLNAFESGGILRTAVFSGILSTAGLALNIIFGAPLTSATFAVFGMVLVISVVSGRLGLRQIVTNIYRSSRERTRVIVYGAGQTGQQLAAALRTDDAVELVAFVDDNPRVQSLTISGVPVHAPSRLKELIARKAINRVVLAMPSASPSVQSRIAMRLRAMGCEVHSLPSFAELICDRDLGKRSTPVSLDDLLGRNRLESELPTVAHTYQGRCVLISGAGGSIGSELCRQLMACKPDRIVLLDHSELALYTIEKELSDLSKGTQIEAVLGSVCDPVLVSRVLKSNKVDVVLHAAAYKHVPMVEKNEIAGLHNNVMGTRILAEAARAAGVNRFILVSSDKAVRPTNVMGASKRMAELVVQDLATRSSDTRFSMVRFGNVLGSSGSVIPLFEEQIARGGPVTLTHGDVARYFMTMSEAARLVLLAGSFARGGDVFVLDMGDLVPIKKLARQMIEGAGFTVRDKDHPHGDIAIKVTGLRPGEKLIEELLISTDMLTTPHPKILRAQESYLSEIEMANALRDLKQAIVADDPKAARAVLARWVEPTKENVIEPAKIS
ncbi:nucleoside-diphosphate sugar epimerase/dehydratase [Thalassobius taeanensis]